MPRKPRLSLGGHFYHVLNRAAKKGLPFKTADDYSAFEALLADAKGRTPMRILAYCLMPSHWHLLLWPYADGDLQKFTQWLTSTHARRWNLSHHSVGRGAVYQSRFKSIPVQGDWAELVNIPQTAAEIAAFREHVAAAVPYGEGNWPIQRKRGRPRVYDIQIKGSDPFTPFTALYSSCTFFSPATISPISFGSSSASFSMPKARSVWSGATAMIRPMPILKARNISSSGTPPEL